MLPSLVIGLREGLEAALIVSIVATFLHANGRTDLLRWVWTGVIAACVVCAGVGIALRIASENLPYRQQEALETVIATVAIAMVTYMIVWMRRHARNLRGDLERATESALDNGSAWALVAMAFLAVFREGFETSVFLVAAFNESDDPAAAGAGALIGVVVACVLGLLIYRGGLRLNLAKFFRITGIVLVFVAAGLVVSALHTAHEAGWLDAGQERVADLTWLVDPGSVRSSLLTGILGLQPRPVVVEMIGWFVYLVAVLAFVLWPNGKPFPRRTLLLGAGATCAGATIAAIVLGVAAPARPEPEAATLATDSGDLVLTAVVNGDDGGGATLTLDGDAIGEPVTVEAAERGGGERGGRRTVVYVGSAAGATDSVDGASRTVTLGDIAAANGGRLPLGVNATTDPGDVEVTASSATAVSVWVDDTTGVVLDASIVVTTREIAALSNGPFVVGEPEEATIAPTDDAVADRVDTAVAFASTSSERNTVHAWQKVAVVIAAVAAVVLIATWLGGGSRGRAPSSRRSETDSSTTTSSGGAGPTAQPTHHPTHPTHPTHPQPTPQQQR